MQLTRDKAHPRSRGENGPNQPGSCFSLGSSPLTRGKPDTLVRGHVRPGLIPAHAGKTSDSKRILVSSTAHPRSRGENMKKADAEALKQGSSPLTRGKRRRDAECCRAARLIPAHAGKT